jgi:hypothetical protein
MAADDQDRRDFLKMRDESLEDERVIVQQGHAH